MQRSYRAQIYWPKQHSQARSGYLVGWNIRSFTGCIATVVPDATLAELQAALRVLPHDPMVAVMVEVRSIKACAVC